LVCTAAVTCRQESVWASVCRPGVPGVDWPIRLGWLDAFGDDQAGGRPLRVVGRHRRGGPAFGARPDPGHRRHHDPVGQREIADPRPGEQWRGHDAYAKI
jgi:hypothetical protein